jgi:hypothetical protein
MGIGIHDVTGGTMSHDMGCSCGREPYEYHECTMGVSCSKSWLRDEWKRMRRVRKEAGIYLDRIANNHKMSALWFWDIVG